MLPKTIRKAALGGGIAVFQPKSCCIKGFDCIHGSSERPIVIRREVPDDAVG